MYRSTVQGRTGLWPYGGVEYDQGSLWIDEYRKDCSGFVSMLHSLPRFAPGSWGGYSTVTLVTYGLFSQINPSDLRMADVIGIMGPNTGGNGGHVMHFEGWYNNDPNDNRCWIWEQAGGVMGPRRRLINYPFGAYRSWRRTWNVDPIVDDSGPHLRRAWPSYMGRNDYFGDINGPDQSHGGYYANERPDVASIQSRLNALGFDSGPVDGIFGPMTIDAVSGWQSALYSDFTTLYGQVWQDDWERLHTY